MRAGSLSWALASLGCRSRQRRKWLFRYFTNTGASRTRNRSYSQKSEPGFPARRRVSRWGISVAEIGIRDTYEAGISTVSTTWITPFDWWTLEIDTIDWSPLASMIQ